MSNSNELTVAEQLSQQANSEKAAKVDAKKSRYVAVGDIKGSYFKGDKKIDTSTKAGKPYNHGFDLEALLASGSIKEV